MKKGSPLIPIFIIVAVDVLGFTLVLPLLPYYAEHFGATPITVGLIVSVFAVCQLVAGPILGRISDNIGRKPVLMFSQLGTLIGFLVLGFAGAIWMIFLSRIIDGLTAGNLSIAQAYISDVTKPEERTKSFAVIGIAFGIGFLIGPALSGFLTRYGLHWPAFAAAILSATSILCTWFLLPKTETKPHPGQRPGRFEQLKQFFVRPESRRPLVEFFCFAFAFSTLISGMALFLHHQPGLEFDAEQTGYVYAFSGLIGGIIQGGLIGRLVKYFGEMKLALVGFITMAIGYGLLGAAHGLPLLLVVIVVSGFGSAVVRPSLTTLITRAVGKQEQGAILGVSQSLMSIAQIVAPIVAGALIERGLFVAYGLTAAAFSAIGAVFLFKRGPQTPDADVDNSFVPFQPAEDEVPTGSAGG